LKMQCAR